MTNDSNRNGLWFLGSQVKIRLASDANRGRISVAEHRLPEGYSPPRHVHVDEDETFYLIEGEMVIEAGDARRTLSVGDVEHAPRGVAHSFLVTSTGGARCLTITTGRFERFVHDVSTPALADRVPDAEELDIAALTAAAARHGIEIVGPRYTDARI